MKGLKIDCFNKYDALALAAKELLNQPIYYIDFVDANEQGEIVYITLDKEDAEEMFKVIEPNHMHYYKKKYLNVGYLKDLIEFKQEMEKIHEKEYDFVAEKLDGYRTNNKKAMGKELQKILNYYLKTKFEEAFEEANKYLEDFE